MYIMQSHMTALTVPEMEQARTEKALSHPQWERNAVADFLGHNERCEPCGVFWRSADDLTSCWLCGGVPADKPRAATTSGPYLSTRGDYPYTEQPTRAVSGCGCGDPTVAMVAKLLAEGVGLWAACRETYAEAS